MFKRREERRRFTYEEKEQMLLKSNGRCAHCGKGLTVSTMTAEHVIPISQGGSNDISNMVALDYKCNAEKDNSIVDPLSYYKYVDEEILFELCQQSSVFYQKQMWLDNKKFLPEDQKTYIWSVPLRDLKNFKSKTIFDLHRYSAKLVLSKANYDDLDCVYIYMGTKLKGMGHETTPKYLKDLITLWFSHGAIYIITNGAKEVLGIVVFYLLRVEYHDVPVPTVWELLFNKKIEEIMFTEIMPDFFRAFCNVNKVAGTASSWIGWCAPTGRKDMMDYIERVGIKNKIDTEEGSIYIDVMTYDKEVSEHKYDVNEMLCNNTYKRID